MRRKDREMPESFALEVIDKCDFGTLAMADAEGQPYCLPLSIVRDDRVIYFHSAMQGEKIEYLRQNPKICLACVGDTHVPPKKFTTEYESAVVFGTASEVTDPDEKIHALRLLCLRYTPDNMDAFDKAIEMSLKRTAIWKLTMDKVTGKRKKYDKDGVEMKFGRME